MHAHCATVDKLTNPLYQLLNYILQSHTTTICGVPQGLILGPLLFNLYMLPSAEIIENFKGILSHICR